MHAHRTLVQAHSHSHPLTRRSSDSFIYNGNITHPLPLPRLQFAWIRVKPDPLKSVAILAYLQACNPKPISEPVPPLPPLHRPIARPLTPITNPNSSRPPSLGNVEHQISIWPRIQRGRGRSGSGVLVCRALHPWGHPCPIFFHLHVRFEASSPQDSLIFELGYYVGQMR